MKFLTPLLSTILLSNVLFSQKKDIEIIQDLILEQEHTKADSLLKEKILNNKIVSSELTFLFGKNSYFLEKYEQSINWLNKYLELNHQYM